MQLGSGPPLTGSRGKTCAVLRLGVDPGDAVLSLGAILAGAHAHRGSGAGAARRGRAVVLSAPRHRALLKARRDLQPVPSVMAAMGMQGFTEAGKPLASRAGGDEIGSRHELGTGSQNRRGRSVRATAVAAAVEDRAPVSRPRWPRRSRVKILDQRGRGILPDAVRDGSEKGRGWPSATNFWCNRPVMYPVRGERPREASQSERACAGGLWVVR